MTPLYIIFVVLYFGMCPVAANQNLSSTCKEFETNFNLKNVVGLWHVVAIIPGNSSHGDAVFCNTMEVSESEEAGIRWMISRRFDMPESRLNYFIKGPLIRQRFHTPKPYDIWSRSIKWIDGCFEQLFSMETNKTDINDAKSMKTYTQFHVIESPGGTLLIQILWGKQISAVIYRRDKDVDMAWLKPVEKFVKEVKGEQRPIRKCWEPFSEIIPRPPNERP